MSPLDELVSPLHGHEGDEVSGGADDAGAVRAALREGGEGASWGEERGGGDERIGDRNICKADSAAVPLH